MWQALRSHPNTRHHAGLWGGGCAHHSSSDICNVAFDITLLHGYLATPFVVTYNSHYGLQVEVSKETITMDD